MLLPMTASEKQAIQAAADSDGAKPVTWAREILMKAARRRGK